MENAVLIRGEYYWFSCHATGLIQVVPLAVDRLKAFEHGTIGAEVIPGTFVLVPNIMDHLSGTVEPVPFAIILIPGVGYMLAATILGIKTPTTVLLLPTSLDLIRYRS